MKATLLILSLAFSAAAFARSNASEIVKAFEDSKSMKCEYSSTSKVSVGLGYVSFYSDTYSCTDGSKLVTLKLHIRSTKVPGEESNAVVTSTTTF